MAENEIVKGEDDNDPISRYLSVEGGIGGVTIKTRCKLCNSKFRKEAEEMYESGKAASDIKKFLDEHGDVIHVSNISHHIKRHYKNVEQIATLIDIRENIKALMERRRTDVEDIAFTVAVGQAELIRCMALQTNGDTSREKDRNEMIMKTLRSIREGKADLRTYFDEDSRVRAVKEKLVRAWAEKINSAKTPEEKELYLETLQNFKTMLEGMPE